MIVRNTIPLGPAFNWLFFYISLYYRRGWIKSELKATDEGKGGPLLRVWRNPLYFLHTLFSATGKAEPRLRSITSVLFLNKKSQCTCPHMRNGFQKNRLSRLSRQPVKQRQLLVGFLSNLRQNVLQLFIVSDDAVVQVQLHLAVGHFGQALVVLHQLFLPVPEGR